MQAAGLAEPQLLALTPDTNNYSVVLFQPAASLEATQDGVHHANAAMADAQFGKFLDKAIESNAELAVTPEYAFPWKTLIHALKAGKSPQPGLLWAFGCESITLAELNAVRDDIQDIATVLFEPLAEQPPRFLNPLVYVFLANTPGSTVASRLVLLVQFKTHPMADTDHFEVNGLQLGTRVYQFGTTPPSLKLATLICSDAFNVTDAIAAQIYARSLILHLQLNPNPRHSQFRQYRPKLLGKEDKSTELVCLNWAQNIQMRFNGHTQCWNNIAGSTWYLQPDRFDDNDGTLATNHRKGLYYTWIDSLRAHALHFNYDPAVFQLTATKSAHHYTPGVLSSRVGPKLDHIYSWDSPNGDWKQLPAAEDGFATCVPQAGGAATELTRVATGCPIAAERVLALAAGRVNRRIDWYAVKHLDSCNIEENEVIQRVTFCQDSHVDAKTFRTTRLTRCSHLWGIITTPRNIPPALTDINQGFEFEWVDHSPHQNLKSSNGKRATVIYMGEETTEGQIEEVAKRTAEYLHRGTASPDASTEARQRLAVWYRDASGTIQQFEPDRYLNYTDPRTASEVDIARPS